MHVQAISIIIVIGALAFICFCIYIFFKQLEFVIKAINLYERMISIQEMSLKILKEIRDGIVVAPVISKVCDQEQEHSTLQTVESVTYDLKTYTEFLAVLGFCVQHEGQKWTLHFPNGTSKLHAYSKDEFKRKVESISKQHGFAFGDGGGGS